MQSWHHQERPDMYVLARAGSSPCKYRARSKGQPDGRPDSGTHCEEDLYSRLHEAEGRCGFLSLLGLSALPGQVRPENIWCKSIRPELRRQQAWQKRLQDGSVRTFPCKCRPAWQYFPSGRPQRGAFMPAQHKREGCCHKGSFREGLQQPGGEFSDS